MKKNKNIKKSNFFTFPFFIFLMLIVIIPNLYYELAMDQQLEIRMLGISVFLGLLFLLIIFNKKKGILKQTDINILKNPVVLIYAVLILIIGISVFWATNKSEAIYEFLKRAAFFILFLYLIIFVLPKENSRLALTKAFILFSLIISLVGIFQLLKILSESKYSIESIYLITGNFAQKNIFSEVLFIAFTFSVYGVAVFDKIWKKAAIIGALFNLLLIAFLMTRAIWVAFFVSFSFTLLLYLFHASKNQLGNKLKPILRYLVIILGVAVLTVVFILLVDKNKTIQNHLANTVNIKEGNSFHRLNLWKKTFSLAQKKPLLGVGAGNWRIEILQYDLQLTTDKGRIMPNRAHNDYLQILVENGIIGLITFVLIFALLLYFCIKTLKKTNNFQDNFFILILFFALIGYMIDSFFAFPRERIELQIFLNIIFALIVFEYNNKFKKEDKEIKSQFSIKLIAVILLCVLAVNSFATYKRLKAEVGVNRIYKYNRQNNYNQIVRITNEIYSPFSTISPFGDPILEIRAMSLYRNKNDLNIVIETLEKSLKDSPYHVETFNILATVYQDAKNYSKALEYSNQAMKYAPSDIRTIIVNSSILISMNKIDDAYKNLRIVNPKNNNIYRKIVNFILVNKITSLIPQTNNKYLSKKLRNVIEKPNFLFKIHSESIEKNENFEKTLLNNFLSTCKDQNNIINDESVKQLKIKYKINN